MKIARIIGAAGTGKTTDLLKTLEKTITVGGCHIHDVGFVSFTRAARREAVSRASAQFGVAEASLDQEGWFKTLHAVCYRVLGGDGILGPSRETNKWVEAAISMDLDSADASDGESAFTGATRAENILGFWGAARNSMVDPKMLHAKTWGLPSWGECKDVIERYETAKRIDHRFDFTDLLGRFAGWQFSTDAPPERVTPEGEAPQLTSWFHDEAQDMSPLTDCVFRRLINQPSVKWVYIVGDPYQSIYTWSGAHWSCMMNYPVAAERTLPQGYRFGSKIHDFAQRALQRMPDYSDRDVRPLDCRDVVSRRRFDWPSQTTGQVDPTENWLLLARTNSHAKRMAKRLDERGVPWLPIREAGGDGMKRTKREGYQCLIDLEAGKPVDGEAWGCAVAQVSPYDLRSVDGGMLLDVDARRRFRQLTPSQGVALYPWVRIDDLAELGATRHLRDLIRSGGWKTSATTFDADCGDAVDRWGAEAVLNPKIRIGTIHASKGAEADNVLLLTSTSELIDRGKKTREGLAAEARVWYVGVTRARRRLVVANEQTRYQELL